MLSVPPYGGSASILGRHYASGRPSWIFAAVTVVAVATALLLVAVVPTGPIGTSGVRLSASIPPWNNWTCNPNNPSPAALDIPVKNPGQPERSGARLNVSYEIEIKNYSKLDRGTVISLPSVKAVFPLSPSGAFSLTFPPRKATVSSRGWSGPGLLERSIVLSANLTIMKGAKAYLTSSKLAVMADRASGSVVLAVRWHWTFDPVNGGTPHVGPWSLPSNSSVLPYLPSVFFPAPFVGLPSLSASPAPSGSSFNLTLNGSVASTSFRVVLEYPNNGTEIQSIWENSSSGITTFNVSVPLTFRNGTGIPAGSYLVHVHDICEAIVHLVSIHVNTSGTTSGAEAVPSAVRVFPR
jgi:hypothetical protein